MKKLLSLFTALVLCTAMWGATYKTFYKVEGALYQGINVDFTTNKNMFVPNGASVTYTTFDGQPADWYNNGSLKKSGQSSYKVSNLADGGYCKYQITNYTGYDAQDPKIDYMYGTVDNKNYFLRAGSGTMYMMSMANAYAVCTEHATASNVGKYTVVSRTESGSTDYVEKYGTYMMYGTDFTHATYGAVKAYDMIVDNPGEMYIDYIVLPIFGYPKTDTTTIEKMIPEGKELTITLYPIDLTLSDKGVYSYTRKTTPITTVTATKENFNQGDKVYNGTVKFDLSNNPLLISGDFVARLTWDDGCNFGLITDNYNLQNYTTWYYCADKKVHYIWNGGGRNASISYHAMFPVLEKKDTKTALDFTYEGGGDEVAIKSNINPSSEDFTIDFGGADWISLDSLRYTTEGKYVAKETVYVVFKTEANTGEAREATITLKHHGKELKYTVSQESMLSAFYEVPANAFFAGMTETGDTAAECKTFYLPYNYGQEYTFTSTEAGDWTSSEEGTPDETNKNYSYSNRTMKDSCHTPLLAVDGKVGYQYGASGESYDENLYFHIGDSVMHYMTPARLYGEYGKPTYYLSANYKTTEYDTVGVYFNNEDVMYIDGISIPIKNSKATGVSDMFPTDDAHVIVNIYKATSAGGKSENKVDRNTRFYTDTLTKGDFKVHPDEPNRGTLNKTFEKPISGPFVVELSDMKHSGCSFTIYSSTEREGENMWGYFYNKGSRTFPGNYTPLISVHAMFPVLYGKSGEDLTIDTIPVTGSTFGDKDCPTRTIYANVKYNKLDEDGWSRKHEVTGVIMRFYNNDRTEKSTKWYFEMSPNTSGAVREGDIIFNLRGKKLAYHVTQAAPTLTPREGMGNEQKFEIPLQDDTVHINGNKVTKVYLESEVSLEDTIKVISKKGLTKIDKTFGSENGKYYVCLTFTRAKCALTDTEDIITVSFEKNANNKYEYTILHKAAGKLTTNHEYRTFVVGPKGGSALAVDENDEITYANSVRVYSDVPATNIRASYGTSHIFDFKMSTPMEDEKGSYRLFHTIEIDGENTTGANRLDSFRVYLPGCDTIKFYVRQETTPRVWQHAADRLTTLEVGNQGGFAHFKGYLTQKMTIVSNTPVTEGDIDIKFSNNEEKWVTPSTEIKQTATRDSVFITFNVAKLEGTEPRSTDITVSILDNEFTVPLTQKTFGIEWSNNDYEEELVVPVAGGIANWKGSDSYYLYVFGTEAYRDALLKVTAPEGVEITRQTDTLTTGRQRATFYFSKKDTLTADWSGEITVKFDSTNTDENFDYHFSKTFTITQAAAKVWLAEDQQPLVIAAEGGDSNEFTIWSNMNIPLKDWEVTQKPEWLGKISGVSTGQEGGSYYRTFKTSAAANTGTEKREGTITIKHITLTNLSIEINISQEPLPAPEPDFTRDVTAGNYGTICLPNAVNEGDYTGAVFYNVVGYQGEQDNPTGIVIESVVGNLEAGMPYIFRATATQIVATYTGVAVDAPLTDEDKTAANGLMGSFETKNLEGEYIYGIKDNALRKLFIGGEGNQVGANRAYIDMSQMSPATAAPAPAPGVHRVIMNNSSYSAPTNLNGLNGNVKATKVLRDGQLYIIRDGKTYNAQGIEL